MRKERDISLIIGSLLIVFIFGLYGSISMKHAIAPTVEPDSMVDLLASAPIVNDTSSADTATEVPTQPIKYSYSYVSPAKMTKPVVAPSEVAPIIDCGFGGCFEQHFTECVPDTKVLAENDIMLRMDILAKTPSGCIITITYTQHPVDTFKGSNLQCLVDNTRSYKDAVTEAFSLAKVGSARCDGTMVALVRNT